MNPPPGATPSASAPVAVVSLRDAWELRNAAAATLIKAEEHVRRLLASGNLDQVVELLEAFSPSRSPGPEWTRTFDLLIERLWMWCDGSTLATLEAHFRARGSSWLAVANALSPEQGEQLRARMQRTPAHARMPAFTLG